jgi:hypothetical protein
MSGLASRSEGGISPCPAMRPNGEIIEGENASLTMLVSGTPNARRCRRSWNRVLLP